MPWLLLLVALATLTAVLIAYRPSFSPPGLHPRNVEYAAAKAEVLVDTADSNLRDSRQNTLVPAKLALKYVLLLHTNEVRAALGRAVKPGQDVAVAGPFTVDLNQSGFLTDPRGLYTPPADRRYRLVVDADGDRPVIGLYSQAPTTREALTLVEAARAVLAQLVRSQGASVPVLAINRTVLRPLGPATGGIVVKASARAKVMAFFFVFVLLVGGSILYAVERRRLRADVPPSAELGRLDEVALADDDWPHTRRVLPWALAGFITMIYLIPFDDVKLPVNLPLDTNLDRPVLVAVGLLWISSLAVLSGAARPRIRLTRIHVAMLVFFAVSCLSVALNTDLLMTMGDLTETLKKIALLLSYIIFFVIASSVLRPREVPYFAALMVALGVIVALATVVEVRWHYNVFYDLWGKILPVQLPASADTIDVIGRLSVVGPTAQPLELAALLGMTLPFALMGTISASTRRRRVLYAAAAGILIAGGLATSRKTSVVAPLGAMSLLLVYRPRAVARRLLQLGLPLVVIVHLIAPGAASTVINELTPGHFGHVTTTTVRVERYDASRPDIMRHPLLGRGFQSFDPHKYRILDNQYLDLLICTGLIGLALYGTIFVAMLVTAHPTIRGPDPTRASLALAASGAVAVIVVANMLFDVISFPHLPYLLFFIAAMILALREPASASRPLASQRPHPTGAQPVVPIEDPRTIRPPVPVPVPAP